MAFDAKTIALALRLETAQFTAGLGMAGARVKTFAGDVKKSAAESGQAFQDAAVKSDKGFSIMSKAGLIAGGAIVAGFGLAVHAAMDFDKQMSEVGAVAGATGDDLGRLRQAALDAGQATVFSASEAAQAEAELAKAGVSTRDILAGGLTGALDLAAAGSIGLASAAEIAANAMNQFNLKGGDVSHIADLLAAGANKSATDVAEMGLALKQGGAQAAVMGISLEQTVGLLSIFAQNALKGSDGGTAMKTMLVSLAGVSGTAKAAIDELGLRFFDAQGEFLGLENAAEELKNKLGPLSDEQRSQALNTIFGTDAARGAIAMMEGGADAVRKWTEDVNQSGYAAQLAGEKNNNLAGDLEQLKGSIETALIEGGSMATDVLRGLTQGITDLVNGLGAMPAPVQAAFLGATGIIGVGATAVGVYGTLAPKFHEVVKALNKMGELGPKVASALTASTGPMMVLIAAATAAAWAFSQQAAGEAAAEQMARRYTDAIMKQTGALNDNIDAQTRKEFADSRVGKILYDTGLDVGRMTQAVRESGTQLDEWARYAGEAGGNAEIFAGKIQGAANAGDELAQYFIAARDAGAITNQELMELIGGLDSMNDAMDRGGQDAKMKEMLDAVTGSASDATGATGELAGQTTELGSAMGTSADQIDAARKALKDYFDQVTSGLSAAIAFEASVDDLAESLREHGNVWNIDTEAGRANQSALIDAKNAAIAHGLEVLNATDSTEQATAAAWGHVGALVETMRQANMTDDEIKILLASMGLTPESIITQFNTPGLIEAQGGTGDLNAKLDRANEGAHVYVTADTWGATSAIDGLLNKLDQLNVRGVERVQQIIAAGGVPGNNLWQANGAVVSYTSYAAGGIRAAEYFANGSEQHIAQIAPAGSWRVWAEPETGGEAYIPLAPSKRPRSLAIWHEVGRQFGVDTAGGPTVVNNTYQGDTINVPLTTTSHSPYETAEEITFRKRMGGRR